MADPILIGVGVVALLAYLKKRQGEQPPAAAPATTGNGNNKQPAAGVDPGKVLGVAGTAASAAAPAIPAGVTAALTTVAQVVGTTVVAAGTALAASEGAGSLDNLLAPDMKKNGGASGAIARMAGAPVFVATMLSGLALFKLIPVAALISGVVGTGVGALVLIAVWFVAVVVEDLSAQAHGQNGAWKELEKTYKGAKQMIELKMGKVTPTHVNPVVTFPDPVTGKTRTYTPEEVERVAEVAALGFAAQMNRIRYNTWMRDKAWGIGANAEGHARFAHKRGYFVGVVEHGGGLVVDMGVFKDFPLYNSILKPEWLQKYVPAADRVKRKGRYRMITVKVVKIGPPPPPYLAKLGFKQATMPQIAFEWRETEYECDAHVEKWIEVGRNLANATMYSKWMGPDFRHFFGPPGDPKSKVVPSDAQHAAYGLSHGRFSGSIEASTGRLIQHADGRRWLIDWRKGAM